MANGYRQTLAKTSLKTTAKAYDFANKIFAITLLNECTPPGQIGPFGMIKI